MANYGATNRDGFLGRTRTLCGIVGDTAYVKGNKLVFLEHLRDALEWWARQSGFKTADATVAIVDGTQEYDLPRDLIAVIYLEHNDLPLTPRTMHEWDRESTDWRDLEAGTPTEYAISGGKLILSPTPGAAAVTADSTVDYRYVVSSGALDSSGADVLLDTSVQLICLRAALAWCALNPDDKNHPETIGNQARVPYLAARLAEETQEVKSAEAHPIEGHQPGFYPATSRVGVARPT